MYVVVHEAKALQREQMNQYYTTKVADLTSLLDRQVLGAETMVSTINSSLIINKLYMQIRNKESVEPYIVSQTMDVLKMTKASGNNLNIYNIVVLFDGYNRAYTASDIIYMSDKFTMLEEEGVFNQISTLNDLIQINNLQIQFNKEFWIYEDDYRYNYGTRKGMVFVLFNKQNLEYQINKLFDSNISWSVNYQGEPLFNRGDMKTNSFSEVSRVNDDFAYEIYVSSDAYELQYDTVWVIALFVGFLICLAYIVVAYVFASRYYKPFGRIRSLIGLKNDMKKVGFDDFVNSVEGLVSERNGYKDKILTISPYVQKGILHSILSGNLEESNVRSLCAKEIIDLEHFYYLLAVINIGYVGEAKIENNELSKIQRIILEQAVVSSSKTVQFLCYEADKQNIYIIINCDQGEKIEDMLYEFYSAIELSNLNKDYVLTLGVDNVKDEVCNLYESFRPATLALYEMVTGGRGAIYFFEDKPSAVNDYYIPKDGVKTLSKAIRDNHEDQIQKIYEDIYKKNIEEFDLSLIGIQSLLDELYIMTVNAVKNSESIAPSKVKVVKLNSVCTLREIIEYYKHFCNLARKESLENNLASITGQQIDQDIITYVDENYRDSDISLSKITEAYQVSNKYVTYVFKKYYGLTYLQYVHEKRINYAVDLLNTIDETLETIAGECGYTNLLTFRRNFQSVMGMNPSDYKDKIS